MVGHCEAGAVKRAFGCAAFAPVSLGDRGRPLLALPVEAFFGGVSVMPSHQTPPSGVRATLVKMRVFREGDHRVGVGLGRGARRDAEEAGLGIDRAQMPVLVGFKPCDVVADRPDLPARSPGSEAGG